jgi:hypothetical protein
MPIDLESLLDYLTIAVDDWHAAEAGYRFRVGNLYLLLVIEAPDHLEVRDHLCPEGKKVENAWSDRGKSSRRTVVA